MELSDQLETKFRLDINQKKALHRLKLFSVADLLFHFPVRYSDIGEVKNIADLAANSRSLNYEKEETRQRSEDMAGDDVLTSARLAVSLSSAERVCNTAMRDE